MDATNTSNGWNSGWVMVRWSESWPSFDGINVLSETAKAVRLQAENRKAAAWFPKSAFKVDRYGAYVVLPWFKKKMTHYEMKAIGYAA